MIHSLSSAESGSTNSLSMTIFSRPFRCTLILSICSSLYFRSSAPPPQTLNARWWVEYLWLCTLLCSFRTIFLDVACSVQVDLRGLVIVFGWCSSLLNENRFTDLDAVAPLDSPAAVLVSCPPRHTARSSCAYKATRVVAALSLVYYLTFTLQRSLYGFWEYLPKAQRPRMCFKFFLIKNRSACTGKNTSPHIQGILPVRHLTQPKKRSREQHPETGFCGFF